MGGALGGLDLGRLDGVEIDGRNREEWSRILEHFDDASIYQTWDYGAVRWGEKNLSHMVFKKKGRIISAAQSRIIRLPQVLKGVAYAFYGPMWRARDQPRDKEAFRLGLRAMTNEYVRKRGLILRIRPWGFEERDADMKDVLIAEGFQRGRGIHGRTDRTILIDLKQNEEELRSRLRKGWLRNLKRAAGEDLEIIESQDDQLWEPLTTLFFQTLNLKKFRPGSHVEDYREIQRRLPPDQKMRTTLCRKGDTFVSAAVCCAIGDTAIGLLSASGPAGRAARAFYLLQWDEVLWAKQKGKASLDLGGVNPQTNPGVYQFKAGLGGRELSRLGVYDNYRNALVNLALRGLEYLVRLYDRSLGRYGAKARRPESPA
jgi:hypothetical protein